MAALGLTEESIEMLNRPLTIDKIEQRPGGNGMLKYLKGDTAITTANEVFGFGGWGYKVVSRGSETVPTKSPDQPSFFYTCDVELYIVGAAFPVSGTGSGVVEKPFMAATYANARKEAETDALKRALVNYGDQFGLCLRNKDNMVAVGDGRMIKVGQIVFDKDNNAIVPPIRRVAPQGTQQASDTQQTAAHEVNVQERRETRTIPTQASLDKEITDLHLIGPKSGNVMTLITFAGRVLGLGAMATERVLSTRELTPKECAAIDRLLRPYRDQVAKEAAAKEKQEAEPAATPDLEQVTTAA